jgi:hypothetical protein
VCAHHRSRDTFLCPSLANYEASRIRPRQRRVIPKSGVRLSDKITHRKEGGEAPKGACQPLPRLRRQVRANVRHSSAARLRAIVGGALAFRRFRRGSGQGFDLLTQLQAMLPGTRIEAGVTRPLLSQSSDSTSRLGRNTEGNDAQSRSGADCEPARKHRTRSTLQIASGMRPSMSEIFLTYPKLGRMSSVCP